MKSVGNMIHEPKQAIIMAEMLKKKQLLFRLGLGGIFLANSVTAWVASGEFRGALMANSLTSSIGHTDFLIKLIGVNDALLFLIILSGKYRKLAAVWASLWLVTVIFVTGFWTLAVIEHLAVLSLVSYYAYARD